MLAAALPEPTTDAFSKVDSPRLIVGLIDVAGAVALFISVAINIEVGAEVVPPDSVIGGIDDAILVVAPSSLIWMALTWIRYGLIGPPL